MSMADDVRANQFRTSPYGGWPSLSLQSSKHPSNHNTRPSVPRSGPLLRLWLHHRGRRERRRREGGRKGRRRMERRRWQGERRRMERRRREGERRRRGAEEGGGEVEGREERAWAIPWNAGVLQGAGEGEKEGGEERWMEGCIGYGPRAHLLSRAHLRTANQYGNGWIVQVRLMLNGLVPIGVGPPCFFSRAMATIRV
jgi:hypothetical protein